MFEENNGEKIYIPKNKINPDLPIELDEDGNLSQNGQIIINLNQAKSNYQYERKT